LANEDYGVCGVYCGQCPSGNGRVKYSAGELKRLIDTTRYEWLNDVEKRFSFYEFRKGLEWFAQAQCTGCLHGGGAPCPNRACAKEKGLRSCLECGEYMACEKTVYVKEWYPFVAENYERVSEVGFDRHLEEEEERARAGVSIMSHLERRCCQDVKLG
jgi:hypothetical protein